MKRLLFLLALPLAAQISPKPAPSAASVSGQVMATALGKPVVLTFQVWAKPDVLPATCDTLSLLVGESAQCQFNLSSPTPKDITVPVVYGSCVSGDASITIPAGKASAPFVVTGVCPTSALNPQAHVYDPDTTPRYAAYVVQPCCARADLCGYQPQMVDGRPCGGGVGFAGTGIVTQYGPTMHLQ
jgi:hypothetical protein